MTVESGSHFANRSENAPHAKSSRLPGFYELAISQRREIIEDLAGFDGKQFEKFGDFSTLSSELVNVFIENGIGTMPMPLGVATNFHINGKDVLVPMAVEETSVLAAASHGAKLARMGGGFQTSSTLPIGTGQIQLYPHHDMDFDSILEAHKQELINLAHDGQQRLLARGGGVRDMRWRYIQEIKSLVIYIDVDTRDAMGANLINTICEKLSQRVEEIIPCEMGLRILTNLCDKRIAKARCRVPKDAFKNNDFTGSEVVDRIVKAYQFAAHDAYRAATHNKGVMNGIDPVVIATGNDWRAVEAGAHAYACRSGVYSPMTVWSKDENGDLIGEIEMPMALGTVGGVTTLHPTAQASLRLMGSPNAQQLGEIVVAVGLAQNLSALRALASEGIQRGHMSLHQGNIRLANQRAQH